VTDYADVPRRIITKLRSVCHGLPEAYEEQAWAGTRWRIRKRTFAHVITVEAGRPGGYARAAGSSGPVTVVTFRSSGPELDALRNSGHPFFGTNWRADEVGMVLDDDVDWDEVAELLTDSYCLLAPKKLAALVDRPAG
jgi:predicted DNA-binding protein (MmcQ/YjbR family)